MTAARINRDMSETSARVHPQWWCRPSPPAKWFTERHLPAVPPEGRRRHPTDPSAALPIRCRRQRSSKEQAKIKQGSRDQRIRQRSLCFGILLPESFASRTFASSDLCFPRSLFPQIFAAPDLCCPRSLLHRDLCFRRSLRPQIFVSQIFASPDLCFPRSLLPQIFVSSDLCCRDLCCRDLCFP
jgi:hypothetical protein